MCTILVMNQVLISSKHMVSRLAGSVPINTLNPKICPNCDEGNTQDARFCSKCKMIMSFEGYQEALESQKQKEDQLKMVQSQVDKMQSQLQTLISVLGNTKDQSQVDNVAKALYNSGIIKNSETSSLEH